MEMKCYDNIAIWPVLLVCGEAIIPWWRLQMKTVFTLLALCAGNSPVTGEFPSQRPVTQRFDVSLICAWIKGWVNNREASDLRHHRAHYDVTVMLVINHVSAYNGGGGQQYLTLMIFPSSCWYTDSDSDSEGVYSIDLHTFANIITHTHIHRDISWTHTVTENRRSSTRQPRSHRWQHELSLWQLRVPPTATKPPDRRSAVINDYGRIGSHRSSKLCVILSDILWKHMQCIPRRQFRHWKTKSRHDAILPPPAASEAVILTTCDATSDDKVSTTTTLGPQRTYFVWRYLLRQICR